EGIGDVKSAQTRHVEALKAYQESATIRETIVKADQRDFISGSNRSRILIKLGDSKLATKNLTDAARDYVTSLRQSLEFATTIRKNAAGIEVLGTQFERFLDILARSPSALRDAVKADNEWAHKGDDKRVHLGNELAQLVEANENNEMWKMYRLIYSYSENSDRS